MAIQVEKLKEVNLNTIVSLATLIVMIVGGGILWQNQVRDTQELMDWRAGHEQLHKERQKEIAEQNGRNEERFRSLERDIQKIDRLDYRLTSTETTTNNTAAAIKDLQTLISQQAGDLKVVREILQRLEASEQRRVR